MIKSASFPLALALLVLGVVAQDNGGESGEAPTDVVTCSSAFRLKHGRTSFFLHSHEINYGSGSGQQSVTGFKEEGDSNSLWQVIGPVSSKTGQEKGCAAGTPIKCGARIRLAHVTTQKRLHSHTHKAPISGNQEVSGYGPHTDTGDNWKVLCKTGFWKRNQPVRFKHVDTNTFLTAARSSQFNNNNCRGCPIIGQLEISSRGDSNDDCKWLTDSGYFLPPPNAMDFEVQA